MHGGYGPLALSLPLPLIQVAEEALWDEAFAAPKDAQESPTRQRRRTCLRVLFLIFVQMSPSPLEAPWSSCHSMPLDASMTPNDSRHALSAFPLLLLAPRDPLPVGTEGAPILHYDRGSPAWVEQRRIRQARFLAASHQVRPQPLHSPCIAPA